MSSAYVWIIVLYLSSSLCSQALMLLREKKVKKVRSELFLRLMDCRMKPKDGRSGLSISSANDLIVVRKRGVWDPASYGITIRHLNLQEVSLTVLQSAWLLHLSGSTLLDSSYNYCCSNPSSLHPLHNWIVMDWPVCPACEGSVIQWQCHWPLPFQCPTWPSLNLVSTLFGSTRKPNLVSLLVGSCLAFLFASLIFLAYPPWPLLRIKGEEG